MKLFLVLTCFFCLANEQKKLPEKIDENFITKFFDQKTKDRLESFLKENPLSRMGQDQADSFVSSLLESHPVGQKLKSHPKIFKATLDVLKDEEALPSLISIVNQKNKLKTYGVIILAVIVSGFLLNTYYARRSFFKRLLMRVLIVLGSLVFNLGAFTYLFREELGPAIRIITRSF